MGLGDLIYLAISYRPTFYSEERSNIVV